MLPSSSLLQCSLTLLRLRDKDENRSEDVERLSEIRNGNRKMKSDGKWLRKSKTPWRQSTWRMKLKKCPTRWSNFQMRMRLSTRIRLNLITWLIDHPHLSSFPMRKVLTKKLMFKISSYLISRSSQSCKCWSASAVRQHELRSLRSGSELNWLSTNESSCRSKKLSSWRHKGWKLLGIVVVVRSKGEHCNTVQPRIRSTVAASRCVPA